MYRELTNFCRERAEQCRKASERATTDALRIYWSEAEARWREAEAQWLGRSRALGTSIAEVEDIDLGRSSQHDPIPLGSTAKNLLPSPITLERFSKWFDTVRANIAMRHSQLSPEERAMYREQAEACRKAADSSKDVDAKEYWLVAEAHWLSLANGSKSPNGAD
jgi:hypothetical protein